MWEAHVRGLRILIGIILVYCIQSRESEIWTLVMGCLWFLYRKPGSRVAGGTPSVFSYVPNSFNVECERQGAWGERLLTGSLLYTCWVDKRAV
jgi:hypothetical protein